VVETGMGPFCVFVGLGASWRPEIFSIPRGATPEISLEKLTAIALHLQTELVPSTHSE
jgi:hypothetical protein